MSWIGTSYDWLAAHHDGIEVVVWAVGLSALFFAGAQLSESRKQRGLTESFTLTDKINLSLSNWCQIVEDTGSTKRDQGRALAEVLTVFEIVADGINRGYLSRMSREILTQQIIGSLKNIYSDEASRESHRFVCDSPGICSAFRIFLLNHHRALLRSDPDFHAFDTIFSPADRNLLGSGFLSLLERRLRVIRLALLSASE